MKQHHIRSDQHVWLDWRLLELWCDDLRHDLWRMAVHHQDQCQTHHCGLRGTSWKSWTLKIIGLDSEGLIIFSYFSRFLLHENTPSETREFAPWPMCCPNFIMKQEQRSRPGATQGGHKEAIFCDGSPDSSPARSFHASRPLEHGSMPQRRRNTTKRAGRSDDGAMMTPG